MNTITAIIHTLNEESNIANAIRSVRCWCDEILVVDMYSVDRTVEIAQELGAKIVMHERMGSADPARAYAESRASSDWIFVLDADEVVPIELATELKKIVSNDLADVCHIPRLNYFGGVPLMHTGWGPKQDYLVRFYKKGVLRHSTDIHTHPAASNGARVVIMPYVPGRCIVHFNYININHFIEKLNRYTSIEANSLYEARKHASMLQMLVKPPLEFVYRFVYLQGFRDGWRGLFYSLLMLIYRVTVVMKHYEQVRVGSAQQVVSRYQLIADTLISGYGTEGKL
jgi:(heptosyl)LPS beta-1,4-glucosyltransferase